MIMELQAPLQLAQLPRSLDLEGKTLFNSVYGLSAVRKTKRYEIVAAVDSEAINLYDVQSSRLITSYSVPPQSSFLCPPCSIRLKNDGRSSYVRLTYCVLQHPEVQLQCFTEKDEGRTASKVATSAFSLDSTQSPVVSLDTVPVYDEFRGNNVVCDVIVVHQDGTIQRIAGDLSERRSSMRITDTPNAPTSSLTVKAAYWMTEGQAKSSVLKNRPDLHLSCDGGGLGLLLMVAKRSVTPGQGTEEMVYGIWYIEEQHLPNTFGGSTIQGTPPLVLHTLPDTEMWKKHDNVQYSFNPVYGALSVAFCHGLNTYDLSTYTPELTSRFSLGNITTSYPMRLSPSLVVGSTSSAVNLYDARYNSVQSTVSLEKIRSGLKRKRNGNANHSPIRFITYFAKIKRLVAFRGLALIAFDIADPGRQRSNGALSGNSMLVNAIGRGNQPRHSKYVKQSKIPFLEFDALPRSKRHDNASWASQQQRLDDFAGKDDIIGFDELMAKELCDHSGGEHFDHKSLRLPRFPLLVDQAKIDYLISKIFEPFAEVDDGMGGSTIIGNSLRIRLNTPRLIHWLMVGGQLTDRRVEWALQQKRPSQTFVMRPGSVVIALTQDKASYKMATNYFKYGNPLPLFDISQAIKLLLADVVASATRTLPPNLLHDRDGDHIMSLAEDTDLPGQGEDAQSIQKFGLSVKSSRHDAMAQCSSSAALLIALEALGLHLSQDITAALRSQLDQSEILAIIQILRQQLFHSGHTSCLPTSPTSAQSTLNDGNVHAGGASLTLDAILKLLSSCLNAIGPVGFLAQTEDDDFLEKLIPDLKSEVSFAFEGLQETNHLQGLLRQVLRYSDFARKGNGGHGTQSPRKHSLLDGQQKLGTIVTLYTEPGVNHGDVEGRRGLLPLSLRADNVISPIKIRKGSGQVSKRSKRDIRKLQDRNVGSYSFERLLL